MNAIQTLIFSITQPVRYHILICKTFKQSLGYFLFWQAIIAVILSVWMSATTYPAFLKFADTAFTSLSANYPDSLILSLQNNELQLEGAATPVNIALISETENAYDNLVIIDPVSVAESVVDKNTFVLVTKSAIAFNVPHRKDPYVINYKDLDLSGSLTKEKLIHEISIQKELIEMLKYFFPLFIFVAQFLALSLGRLLYLFINTTITYFIGWVLGRNYGYAAFFKLGLHAIIPAEIIFQITRFAYQEEYPVIFTLAFIAIVTVAVLNLNSTKLRG